MEGIWIGIKYVHLAMHVSFNFARANSAHSSRSARSKQHHAGVAKRPIDKPSVAQLTQIQHIYSKVQCTTLFSLRLRRKPLLLISLVI